MKTAGVLALLLTLTWGSLEGQLDKGDEIMLAISGAVIGFVAINVARDGGGSLNRFADDMERRTLAPLGADWYTLGNPVTWVHHALSEAVVIGAAYGLARLVGADPKVWARRWGWAGVGLYGAREFGGIVRPPRETLPWFSTTFPYTSRRVDSILDVVFPAGVTWLLTR